MFNSGLGAVCFDVQLKLPLLCGFFFELPLGPNLRRRFEGAGRQEQPPKKGQEVPLVH